MNRDELRQATEAIWRGNVHRQGVDNLLDRLKGSDYYMAPCSTQHHLSCEGGLATHTINVYEELVSLLPDTGIPEESITIAAMGHDLCKIGFYKPSFRNKKNERTGAWEKAPWYDIEDQLPLGHGEKSVIFLQQYMTLTFEEMMAIRWHMGGFTPGMDYTLQQAWSKAAQLCPLVPLLHAADLLATHITEAEEVTERVE